MRIFLYFILFVTLSAFGQDYQSKLDSIFADKTILVGDSIPHVNIDEVVVYAPRFLRSPRDFRRNKRLIRKVKKVYPYAKIANQWLVDIEKETEKIESDYKRKRFIKAAEKRLRAEFEEELVKLTYSEGRLLIKLIDRETGETSYELIKELRGSFQAFFWQSIARLFGSDLKSEYDPEGADILIEEIIRMIDSGQI